MSRIDGVTAYLVRTYREREKAKIEITNCFLAVAMGVIPKEDYAQVEDEFHRQLTCVMQRSEEVGSMRRLLGDLKHLARKVSD